MCAGCLGPFVDAESRERSSDAMQHVMLDSGRVGARKVAGYPLRRRSVRR
jgi:hypothetical protein